MERSIEDIKGHRGSLVLDHVGTILSSSGDLENNKQAAKIIYHMLQDTNFITSSQKGANFKRLTVAFDSYAYLATIGSDNKIYIIKKDLQ